MIVKDTILFTPVNKTRGLHIWLPDDYDMSEERYPVMYMFDGHNLFSDEDATYGKSWGLAGFMRRYEKPMIIVGLECGHEGNERLIEYCPYKNFKAWFCGTLNGIGDETMDWMVNTLKPMIDARFRTYPDRACTGIAGSSMGGLMALYAVMAHNDVFSKAACLSPAIGPCIGQMHRDLESRTLDPDTRVYLSWGEVEAGRGGLMTSRMAQMNIDMCERLRAKGVLAQVYGQPKGGHNEASWELQNNLYMRWLWNDTKLF